MDEAAPMDDQNPPSAGFSLSEEPAAPPIARLLKNLALPNIASEMDSDELGKLGQTALREYEIDKASRSEWEERNRKAMDLAMQVTEEKTFPWKDAANVKYPLLTTAAIQFQARAYPAVVQGQKIAKAEVVGFDPNGAKKKRADRIGKHLSYQLSEQIENWESDTDRLLMILPLEGVCFRKSYFDPRLARNASDLVRAVDLVINFKAKSLESAPRVTQEFKLYPYEIKERQLAGVYLDVDLQPGDSNDTDDPHEMLEQHRQWDMDGDGYPEPYIVTLHKKSCKVVRVVARYDLDGIEIDAGMSLGDVLKRAVGEAQAAGIDQQSAIQAVMPALAQSKVLRIEPVRYFTKYGFMPNPESAVYDLGLGTLLNPINESINTVLNQLLDAGTLSITGGGFIGSGVRMKTGSLTFAMGEYKVVPVTGDDLRKNIVPLQFSGPSAVLFNLLGLLVDAGREIASVKDVLSGEQKQSNVPATTTLALIEQGLKVFTAIYKRIHRSLRDELQKFCRLNRLYLKPEEYFRVLDGDPQVVTIQDYNDADIDVRPYSDPSISTEAQKLGRAQAAMQLLAHPLSNQQEIMRRYYEAIGEENPDQLFAPPPQGPPPELIKQMAELEIKARESQAKVMNLMADSFLKIAQGEAAELGPQFQMYTLYLEAITKLGQMNGQQRLPAMAGHPGNQGLPEVPGGLPGTPPGAQPGLSGGGMSGLMGPGQGGPAGPPAY